MALVLKFDNGGTASKADEIQNINEWNLEILAFMSNPDADPNLKAQFTKYSSNILKRMGEISGARSRRKLQHAALELMHNFISGNPTYNPADTSIAMVTGFGNYTPNQSYSAKADANQMWKITVGDDIPSRESTDITVLEPSVSVTTDPNTQNYYEYNWKGGRDFSVLPTGSTLKERLRMALEGIKSAITDLSTAQTNNLTLLGVEPGKVKDIVNKLPSVTTLLSKLDSQDDDTNFKQFLDIIKDSSLLVDADELAQLFPERYTGSQSSSVVQADYPDSYVQNYFNSKGWRAYKNTNGAYGLIGADNQPITNRYYIFNDPTKENFGKALFVDANGLVHYGNLQGEGAIDSQDVGTELYSQALRSITPTQSFGYNFELDENELLDHLYRVVNQGGESKFPELYKALHNPDTQFVDLSYNMSGDEIVLGVTSKQEVANSPFGINWSNKRVLIYDPATKRWRYDYFDKIKDKYVHAGADTIGARDLFNILSPSWSPSKTPSEEVDAQDLASRDIGDMINRYYKKTGENVNYLKEVETLGILQANVNFMIAHINGVSPADKLFFEDDNDKYNIAYGIWQQYKLGLVQLNADQIKELKKILNTTPSHKNGGVLKAKDGTYFHSRGNGGNYTTSSADTKVERAKQVESVEGFSWKGEDTLRVISLLADLGGIVSSNAVGWGTLGAGLLGAASTGLDYWADSIDDTVTKELRLANLGMGAGATVVGLIPDAKAVTTGAKSLKFLSTLARRAGGFAALLGTFGLVKEDINRISELCTNPDSREFTGDDMKLIMNTLRILATAALTGKMRGKLKKIAEAASDGDNRLISTKGKDGNKTDVSLNSEQFDKIMETGHTKGQAEADKLFRSYAKEDQVAEDARFPVDFGESKWEKRGHRAGHASKKAAGFVLGWPVNESFHGYLRGSKPNVTLLVEGSGKSVGAIDEGMATWGSRRGIEWPAWMTGPRIVAQPVPTSNKQGGIIQQLQEFKNRV